VKSCPEVCRVFCATANPLEVVLAESDQGRGVLGVIDGARPKGVEDEAGVAWRHDLLRTIGYKRQGTSPPRRGPLEREVAGTAPEGHADLSRARPQRFHDLGGPCQPSRSASTTSSRRR